MEQLYAILDMSKLITNPIFLFFIGFLGVFSHAIKKYQRKQFTGNRGFRDTMMDYFFRKEILNTLLTFIAYIISFFVLYETRQMNIFAAFSAGYMADSIFNKLEQGETIGPTTSSEVKPSGEGEL